MTKNKKIKLAILISGFGSNLQAIINQIKSKKLLAEIVVVVSNNPNAYGLKRAEKNKIPTEIFSLKKFIQNYPNKSRRDYDEELANIIKKYKPDLIVLAGWMLILSNNFLRHFKNKVINLHPALIPAFPGTEAIKQAFDFGVKYTGVTVHFVVDEGVDTGPVILQKAVEIKQKDTLETLTKRIHRIEHKLLPQAIRLIAQNKVKIIGRKVIIK